MPDALLLDPLDTILAAAHPITGAAGDYDPLLELIGDARFVLLGEATHGTHEFYRSRADITSRLIVEKGFTAVAVEADWPDAHRVNRYVRGEGDDPDARAALAGFERFPTWMWRNTVVLEFAAWLRTHNDEVPPGRPKAGFYGLDLYSLHASIRAVLDYLDRTDPDAARRARRRYACFDHFGADPQNYGLVAGFGLSEPCREEAVGQLVELQRRSSDYLRRGGSAAENELFSAVMNARVIADAEAYYRTMFRGRNESWNLRDRHMADTLQALDAHLSRSGTPAKIVVWEHNSHLGNARATEMGWSGELNVGQLVRERYGRAAAAVGFTTYDGTVTAASDWDGPAEKMSVRPAVPDSYEAMFHEARIPDMLLGWRNDEDRAVRDGLRTPRLERAIGVVYRPQTERESHWFHANLAEQFDAVIHFDRTSAVEPLERHAEPLEEPAETYPSGL